MSDEQGSGADPAVDSPPTSTYPNRYSSCIGLHIPNLPTRAPASPSNYDTLNTKDGDIPGIEALSCQTPQHPAGNIGHSSDSSDANFQERASTPGQAMKDTDSNMDGSPSQSSTKCHLLEIPGEIMDLILSFLTPYELKDVVATCRSLREHGMSDLLWQPLVQCNVPNVRVRTPYPCSTFHDLYAELDRFWFLSKHKIWFSDTAHHGKAVVAQYDPQKGCIEGYELVAMRISTSIEPWAANAEVTIFQSDLEAALHMEKPVLRFTANERIDDGGFKTRPGANRFADEIPMVLDKRLERMRNNFSLARPLKPELADVMLSDDYPYGRVWPPPTVPASEHAVGLRPGNDEFASASRDRPCCRSEVSDKTFRVRRWLQMTSPSLVPHWRDVFLGHTDVAGGEDTANVHLGEEIHTFSTLEPSLYTPSQERPWRGIWVGEYPGHGSEFLLITQSDEPPVTDAELGLVRLPEEPEQQWHWRRLEARRYRGRLEAIKLTGDPNVPRGEYTFVADDLGPDGFVGVASEPPFTGARIVKSKGHIAGSGFVQDKFVESQLFLISPIRLAQYWIGSGHITTFDRVDIDWLIDSTNEFSKVRIDPAMFNGHHPDDHPEDQHEE